MNALFLKDLADKTRRGQRGRIEAGNQAAVFVSGMKSSARSAPPGSWSLAKGG